MWIPPTSQLVARSRGWLAAGIGGVEVAFELSAPIDAEIFLAIESALLAAFSGGSSSARVVCRSCRSFCISARDWTFSARISSTSSRSSWTCSCRLRTACVVSEGAEVLVASWDQQCPLSKTKAAAAKAAPRVADVVKWFTSPPGIRIAARGRRRYGSRCEIEFCLALARRAESK